ncbi:MAG TPA: SMI1/KNR4 family protein [Pseudogracilibacillus sp.]|nr:SMI1/KNR4 family protein [Pseudogracilibacillus sp.]
MPNHLWENDMDALPPFNDKTIHIVEEKLQLSLPVDYIELMKMQNGGRLHRNLFKLDDKEIFIDELFGISTNEAEGILTSIYMREEWGLPENIILLSGDGHSWVFLDYRKSVLEPSVSYLDQEAEKDYMLAASFTDFMHGLSVDESIGEVEVAAEGVYTRKAFEKIVAEADDPFSLTDGVLYFTEIHCDMAWLITQVTQMMDIDSEESEFILPEVLYYLVNKISKVQLTTEATNALQLLAKRIEMHELLEVRKYDKKIEGLMK